MVPTLWIDPTFAYWGPFLAKLTGGHVIGRKRRGKPKLPFPKSKSLT